MKKSAREIRQLLIAKEEKKITGWIFWSFISLFIYEVIKWVQVVPIPIANFFILIYVSIFCLCALYFKNYWKEDIPKIALVFYVLFFVWNIITFLRGVADIQGYFGWKRMFFNTNAGLATFIPLSIVVGLNFSYCGRIYRFCLNTFKYSFLIIPFAFRGFAEMYSRTIVAITYFIMLFPYIKKRDRIIIIVVSALSTVIGLSWRTNAIRIAFAFGLLLIFYFRKWIQNSWLRFIQVLLFIIPLYFLYQGIQGDSIFTPSEKRKEEFTIKSTTGKEEEEELVADTRTFLYEEVLMDLSLNDQLLSGKGANGHYKTDYFFEDDMAIFVRGREETEVGFLNILLYSGIIGVLLYAAVLWIAVYYGTSQSSNTLTKLLAMYLSFHWTMLFIEDIVFYDIYYYFNWVAIGFCFSRQFRELTDDNIKEWFERG